MKSLKQVIFTECGTTTPGSTLGIGNPVPPSSFGTDPTTPGSGDIPTAKTKRKKLHRFQTNEGLLDIDLDIQDDVVATTVCKDWAEKLCKLITNNDVQGYLKYCKEMEDEVSAASLTISKSLMALLRSKEYTFITFKPKLRVQGRGEYVDAIEIRKFIQNPLPDVMEIFSSPDHSYIRARYRKRANHPTILDLKNNRVYVLKSDVFDIMFEELKKSPHMY